MMRVNKKGFTMVELLATITILSILTVVILFSVKNVIEKSHKSYYDGEEKMITLSGQTYFGDYNSKLPKEIGGIEKVTLKTLIDEKYIDPVYNHNKEVCFYDQSFVYAQKIDDENYQYYTYLSCPGGYNTEIDKTKPVIKFNPNKGLSNKDIEVKMEITDNKNIKSYQYIVLKNDVEVKNSNIVPYKENPTITLTEDGIYQIIGYAWDDATNMGTKTSGKYEIKKTGPNCSNIVFNIDKTPEVWTTGQVNLTIQVPEDTQRWTWATRNALNLTSSTAYGKAKQYLGTSSQTVSFTKDGQNQGKITLYDKVGNHCSIETARYFLWNSPPTFSDFTITSTVKEYNAVTTKLTIPASNPPGLPMQMYISNNGFETGGSWENYAPTKDWNVGGTMDGGTRTVYITIRDSLGNKKNIKKTYKVYHECQNLKADAAIYGPCGEPCRETWVTGTQSVTIHNRDRLTNKICRTDNSTQQCNTQMCCSSVNYSGWSGCSAACASNGVVPTKTRTATSAYKPSRTCTTSDNSSIQLVTSSGCQTSDCCSSLREVLGSWSGCDKECGGGKKYQSAEYYSNYDGRWCKSESKARSQDCNTQSCIKASIETASYKICPSDYNSGAGVAGCYITNADINEKGLYNETLIVTTSLKGSIITVNYRVHLNNGYSSSCSQCPERQACISDSNNNCVAGAYGSKIFNLNTYKRGADYYDTIMVDVSGWKAGEYKLIVTEVPGSCKGTQVCNKLLRFKTLNNYVIFKISE